MTAAKVVLGLAYILGASDLVAQNRTTPRPVKIQDTRIALRPQALQRAYGTLWTDVAKTTNAFADDNGLSFKYSNGYMRILAAHPNRIEFCSESQIIGNGTPNNLPLTTVVDCLYLNQIASSPTRWAVHPARKIQRQSLTRTGVLQTNNSEIALRVETPRLRSAMNAVHAYATAHPDQLTAAEADVVTNSVYSGRRH